MMNRLSALSAFLAAALLFWMGCASQEQPPARVSDQANFTRQVNVPPNSKIVEIIHYNGNVNVIGWDRNDILMEGIKRASSNSVQETRGILDFITIDAYERGTDRLVLEYNGPSTFLGIGRNDTGIDATIHVPRTMAVDLQCRYGDVQVSDMNANVAVDHRQGDVKLEHIDGRVQVRSQGRTIILRDISRSLRIDGRDANVNVDGVKGDASIQHSGGEVVVARVDGKLVLNTSKSNLTLNENRGRIELDNREGDVMCNGFYEGLQAYVKGGTLNAQPQTPVAQSYYCSVDNGDLILRVPDSSSMLVDITAEQGRIQSDFNLPVSTQNTLSTARGAVNGGEHNVQLNVRKGSVSLFKAAASAIPSAS